MSDGRLLRTKMAVAGALGHTCMRCGRVGRWPWESQPPGTPSLPVLEVGHPNGRNWSIRRLNTLQRWTKYLLKEVLPDPRWSKRKHRFIIKAQAECGPCNRKHGARMRYPGPVDKTRQGQPRRLRKQYQRNA